MADRPSGLDNVKVFVDNLNPTVRQKFFDEFNSLDFDGKKRVLMNLSDQYGSQIQSRRTGEPSIVEKTKAGVVGGVQTAMGLPGQLVENVAMQFAPEETQRYKVSKQKASETFGGPALIGTGLVTSFIPTMTGLFTSALANTPGARKTIVQSKGIIENLEIPSLPVQFQVPLAGLQELAKGVDDETYRNLISIIGATAVSMGAEKATMGAGSMFDVRKIGTEAGKKTGVVRFPGRGLIRKAARKTKDLESKAKSIMKQHQTKLNQGKAVAIQQVKDNTDEVTRLTTRNIDDQLFALNDELSKAIHDGTDTFKQKVIDVTKKTSETYGKHLDDVFDSLEFSGNRVFQADIDDMANSVIAEANEMGLSGYKTSRVVNKIRNKFVDRHQQTQINVTPRREATQITAGQLKNPDKVVDLKKFHKSQKDITKTVSKTTIGGGQKLTEEEMVVSLWKKHYGKMMDDISDGAFTELNSKYASSMEIQKEAWKTFKPGLRELGKDKADALLSRVITGKNVTRDDITLIDKLEKGIGLSPGTGNVTTRARLIQQRINQLEATKEGGNKLAKIAAEEQLKAINNFFELKQFKLDLREARLAAKVNNAREAARYLKIGVIGANILGAGMLTRGAISRQGRDMARNISKIPIFASAPQQ